MPIDTHAPFLEASTKKVERAGHDGRIVAKPEKMHAAAEPEPVRARLKAGAVRRQPVADDEEVNTRVCPVHLCGRVEEHFPRLVAGIQSGYHADEIGIARKPEFGGWRPGAARTP